MDTPRLLLVFAHPDDESVFAAGAAAACVAAGGRVALCTATPGEHGKVGAPPVCDPAEPRPPCVSSNWSRPAGNSGSGRCGCSGTQDRALAIAPSDTIRRQLVEVMRAVRPQVVITFEPSGSNLHPDHVAISRFTSDAVAAAADARWFPDLGAPHVVRRLLWTLPDAPVGAVAPRRPVARTGRGFPDRCPGMVGAQGGGPEARIAPSTGLDRIFFSKPDVTGLLGVEMFRLASGRRPRADRRGRLFADIL